MKIPLTIALFSTTKGHYGKTTLYQDTVNRLNSLIPLNLFSRRVVHIKREVGPDHDFIYNEMVLFFTKFNFTILETFGAWKHYDGSHYNEHAKDIYTLMSNKVTQSSEYILWIEDDILINCNNFEQAIFDSISILKSDPTIMNVGIRDILDEKLVNEKDLTKNIKTFGDSLNFSFRCSIFRARDVFALASFYKNAFRFGQSPHIEAFAAQILSYLSCRVDCLAIFNKEFCSHQHIGVK